MNKINKMQMINILNNGLLNNSPYFFDNIDVLNFASNVDILENLNSIGKFVSFIDSITLGISFIIFYKKLVCYLF